MVMMSRRRKSNGGKRSSSGRVGIDNKGDNDEKPKKKTLAQKVIIIILLSAFVGYGVSETIDLSLSSLSSSSSSSSSMENSTITTANLSSDSNSNSNSSSVNEADSSNNKENNDIFHLQQNAQRQYQNCSVSYKPPPPRTNEKEWRKPLWIPAMPASGAAGPTKKGDLMKALVDAITGLDRGTKNYHMSMRNRLRRCKGVSETAACTQGHPYVPIGPEKQTDNFQSPVILALRNPRDVCHATHTEKHIAYHNGKGQAPENQWRKFRDEYCEGSLKSWKEMIEWWTSSDYYMVKLFVSYEQLIHPTTGPSIVEKISNIFQQAGFDVATSSSDLSCIWYQAIQPEWERQKKLMGYIPGYRSIQRDNILSQLQEFIKRIEEKEKQQQKQGDVDGLLTIMHEYETEIRDNTRIDEMEVQNE